MWLLGDIFNVAVEIVSTPLEIAGRITDPITGIWLEDDVESIKNKIKIKNED